MKGFKYYLGQLKRLEVLKRFEKNEDLRLVVMNRDSFEEKFSFNLNLRNLYIFISSLFVLFFVLYYLLIAYTPLKRLIPGYGTVDNNSYVIKMNKNLNELEKKIEAQDHYNQALRRILIQNESGSENDEDYINAGKLNSQASLKSRKEALRKQYFAPLKGKINRKSDIKNGHYGIDISGTKNSPIKAIADGNVIFADWSTETGYTIIVQHRNGLISLYKHNASLLKEIGDFVDSGEAIAIFGNTGTLSTGPHLHFEIWKSGIPIDPLEIIEVKM
ncbi:MAG: M23 family metallopeptidase [Saprospiraceae bacterium]|nr:M23 family metallopeptidase [Saprospiraceae bacterium]